MWRKINKVWNVVTTVVVSAVVIFAVLLVGARVVGLQVFTVLSGSMEPAYPTGSLIYVKDVDASELEAGQVITFMLNENTVATHRIVAVVRDTENPDIIRFRTKGDANEAEDGSLVHYKNVIGTPVFKIPYLGYAASYIQSVSGIWVAMAACVIILLFAFLPELFKEDKEEKEDSDK